jgi:hypothetical protein
VTCVVLAVGLVVALADPALPHSQPTASHAEGEAERLVASGVRLLKAGELDRAEAEFTLAVAREPRLSSAH